MNLKKKAMSAITAAALMISALPSQAIPASAADQAVLNKKSVTLKAGESVKLKVKLTGKYKKKKILWKSSKASVAKVNAKGKVTAKKAGTAKISAKLVGVKKTLTCKVKVKAKQSGSSSDTVDSGNVATIVPTQNAAAIESPGVSSTASPAVSLPGSTTNANPATTSNCLPGLSALLPSVSPSVISSASVSPGETFGSATMPPASTSNCVLGGPTVRPVVRPTPGEQFGPGIIPSASVMPGEQFGPTVMPPATTANSVLENPMILPPVGPSVESLPRPTMMSPDSSSLPVPGDESPSEPTVVSTEIPAVAGIYSAEDYDSSIIEKSLKKISSQLAEGETAAFEIRVTDENVPDLTLGSKAKVEDLSNMHLVLQVPNGHIENYYNFASVTVLAISDSTYVEHGKNRIDYQAEQGSIEVAEEGKITNLTISEDQETKTKRPHGIHLKNKGHMDKIDIQAPVQFDYDEEEEEQAIPVEISESAQDEERETSIQTDGELEIDADVKINLTTEAGAEDTTVTIHDEASMPEVDGLGRIEVSKETADQVNDIEYIVADPVDEMEVTDKLDVVGRIRQENTGDTVLDEETGDTLFTIPSGVADVEIGVVPYDEQLLKEDADTYISNHTEEIKWHHTDQDGVFEVPDVFIGNYFVIAMADGYKPALSTLILTQKDAQEGKYFYMHNIPILPKEKKHHARLEGQIIDSTDGKPVGAGIEVRIRGGHNNLSEEAAYSTVTDEEGNYQFEDIEPDQYTINVLDTREDTKEDENEYWSDDKDITIDEGENVNNVVMNPVSEDENIRFVLTWGDQESGASKDLDLHLVRMQEDKSIGHVFWKDEYQKYYDDDGKLCAAIDVDDKEYEGPETITMHNLEGKYTVYVHDYYNTTKDDCSRLAAADAKVTVYSGQKVLATYYVPQQMGTLWHVCDFDAETLKLTAINEISEWNSTYGQIADDIGKDLELSNKTSLQWNIDHLIELVESSCVDQELYQELMQKAEYYQNIHDTGTQSQIVQADKESSDLFWSNQKYTNTARIQEGESEYGLTEASTSGSSDASFFDLLYTSEEMPVLDESFMEPAKGKFGFTVLDGTEYEILSDFSDKEEFKYHGHYVIKCICGGFVSYNYITLIKAQNIVKNISLKIDGEEYISYWAEDLNAEWNEEGECNSWHGIYVNLPIRKGQMINEHLDIEFSDEVGDADFELAVSEIDEIGQCAMQVKAASGEVYKCRMYFFIDANYFKPTGISSESNPELALDRFEDSLLIHGLDGESGDMGTLYGNDVIYLKGYDGTLPEDLKIETKLKNSTARVTKSDREEYNYIIQVQIEDLFVNYYVAAAD